MHASVCVHYSDQTEVDNIIFSTSRKVGVQDPKVEDPPLTQLDICLFKSILFILLLLKYTSLNCSKQLEIFLYILYLLIFRVMRITVGTKVTDK